MRKKKNEYQEIIWGCDIVRLSSEERKGSGRREKKAGTLYFQVTEFN